MKGLLRSLIEDPEPTLVMEVSTDGIVAVRRSSNGSAALLRAERSFAPGTLDPAPTRPNITNAGEFAAALGGVLDDLGPRNGSETALILPDASSRVTVLDFDELPSGAEERLRLIRSRLTKAVPFDITAARIAYQVSAAGQGYSVLVALTPAEVVRQYEDALAHLGLWSGYVSVSSAAALNLLSDGDMILFVKLAPSGLMTLAAIENGIVRLVRSVDLGSLEARSPEELLNDMLADIFPTQVFVADSLGQSVDQLVLCGFGEFLAPALERFPQELGCAAKPLESERGAGWPAGRGHVGVSQPVMRVDLNLATRPFGRSRLFWTASAAIGAVLLVITVGLLYSFWRSGKLPPELAAKEMQLRAELAELTSEESQFASALRQPETLDIYDRSYFLNQLLTRKGISWTETFGDLEDVLPPRVLMMQIRPEVTFDNKVRLEMQVGAETPADFIEFLKALESSEVFGSPSVRGFNPPTDNEPYFRYQLMVEYEQQL